MKILEKVDKQTVVTLEQEIEVLVGFRAALG